MELIRLVEPLELDAVTEAAYRRALADLGHPRAFLMNRDSLEPVWDVVARERPTYPGSGDPRWAH
jgi:hypothetical protein